MKNENKMKQIMDLKQGDKFYDISFTQVIWYRYLCIHPTGQGKYHILIDMNEEPIRIYYEKLQNILNKNFKTYHEAKLALADKLENIAKKLREEDESI